MIKRLRHIRLQEDQMDNIQQPLPIALTLILKHWDILGVGKFDDLAYEDTVVFLIQHLEPRSNLNDVERLIFQAFSEQQGYTQFTPEQSLMLEFLADDVFESWRAYLARNNPLAFTPNSNTHARARGLLGRQYSPKTSTR